jgi:hypothetical protein
MIWIMLMSAKPGGLILLSLGRERERDNREPTLNFAQ